MVQLMQLRHAIWRITRSVKCLADYKWDGEVRLSCWSSVWSCSDVRRVSGDNLLAQSTSFTLFSSYTVLERGKCGSTEEQTTLQLHKGFSCCTLYSSITCCIHNVILFSSQSSWGAYWMHKEAKGAFRANGTPYKQVYDGASNADVVFP